MKKFFVLLLTGIMVLVFNCIVFAGEYTYKPPPHALDILYHGSAYSWEIDLSKPSSGGNGPDFNSETINGASLIFNDICNWKNGDGNVLHVSLLDDSTINSGVISYPDPQDQDKDSSNYFVPDADSPNTLLFRFNDMSTTPEDIKVDLNHDTDESDTDLYSYTYTYRTGRKKHYTTATATATATMHMPADSLGNLISYASSGIFGLGFDPDCHFYNWGIKLTLSTEEKTPGNPVPEPATFLLFGAGLLFFASKMRKKYIEV